MKITVLEEYGLRHLLQLAKAGDEETVPVGQTAEQEGFSRPGTHESQVLEV